MDDTTQGIMADTTSYYWQGNMADTRDMDVNTQSENSNLRLEGNDERWRYIPLLKATLKGEWECAKRIFDQDESALTAKITETEETTLHLAVGSGRSIDFVEKLVDLMSPEALALPDIDGLTALHWAAYVGNTKAAVILVQKHPTLLYIRDIKKNWLPLHWATNIGHKDTLKYLLSVTQDDPESMPFASPSAAMLLWLAVDSEFYDIALNLIDRYPQSATPILDDGHYALLTMSKSPSSFQSGNHLNCWKRLIYSSLPLIFFVLLSTLPASFVEVSWDPASPEPDSPSTVIFLERDFPPPLYISCDFSRRLK